MLYRNYFRDEITVEIPTSLKKTDGQYGLQNTGCYSIYSDEKPKWEQSMDPEFEMCDVLVELQGVTGRKADQLELTFPTVLGQLPKLAIGAVRNAL